MERLKSFIFREGPKTPKTTSMGELGFGPNRVVVEVARAKRTDVPMRDKNGEIYRNKQGEIIYECLLDEDGNVLYHEELEIYENPNVTCNTGLEAAKDRLFNSGTTETTAHYIAVSESTATPAAGDTDLDGEITENGLERAAAAYSSDGTGVCDLSKTFTATGSFSTVGLMGLFDAASSGDMYFEATFTAVALESGDQLTAKWDPITMS